MAYDQQLMPPVKKAGQTVKQWLQENVRWHDQQLADAEREIKKLEAANKVLRDGLEVYADYSNWYFSEHEQADCFHHSGSVENGQTIAQQAIAEAARIDEKGEVK